MPLYMFNLSIFFFSSQAEVSHRLTNAKEAASRVTGLQSHEDLAKKLQVTHNLFSLS